MYALAEGLCFAYRQLRRTPLFALLLVLTLSLGIGGTTAIFSLVEGILLRPLPFNHPDRLVLLGDHLGIQPAFPSLLVRSEPTGAPPKRSPTWEATSTQVMRFPAEKFQNK